MSIERLSKKYGHFWTTQPPADAQPFVIEGAINITELQEGVVHKVLQWQAEDNTLAVIQHFFPFAYDVAYPNTFQAIQPASLAGQLTFHIRKNETLYPLQQTQYPNNSGYLNAPNDGELDAQEGLSLLFPVDLEKSPIVITEAKGFDVIIKIQDLSKGAPIPERGKRFFCARVTGFTLYTY